MEASRTFHERAFRAFTRASSVSLTRKVNLLAFRGYLYLCHEKGIDELAAIALCLWDVSFFSSSSRRERNRTIVLSLDLSRGFVKA